MSALCRYCCKSLFALLIKNSPDCRRNFRVKMWGTSSPDDKLTGDLGNVIEPTQSGGRRLVRVMAGKLSPGNFRLLQHGVIPGSCHTKAQGISSPEMHEAILMRPRNEWRAAMEYYVGLDVSLKQTSICVVNQVGSVVREGVVDSEPEAIAAFVRSKAPGTVRVGLNNETKGFLRYGGKRCPCRGDGDGEIARFFASFQSERLRFATLIHQRRLTPSFGGQVPTAE